MKKNYFGSKIFKISLKYFWRHELFFIRCCGSKGETQMNVYIESIARASYWSDSLIENIWIWDIFRRSMHYKTQLLESKTQSSIISDFTFFSYSILIQKNDKMAAAKEMIRHKQLIVPPLLKVLQWWHAWGMKSQ